MQVRCNSVNQQADPNARLKLKRTYKHYNNWSVGRLDRYMYVTVRDIWPEPTRVRNEHTDRGRQVASRSRTRCLALGEHQINRYYMRELTSDYGTMVLVGLKLFADGHRYANLTVTEFLDQIILLLQDLTLAAMCKSIDHSTSLQVTHGVLNYELCM